MIGVAEDDLRAGFADLSSRQAFHGPDRADRHERWQINHATGTRGQASQAGAAMFVHMQQLVVKIFDSQSPRREKQNARVMPTGRRNSTYPTALFAAELQVPLSQLLANLSQAGDAEVFALQQVVSGFANQFGDRGQSQTGHAFASTHGKIQI